MRERKNTVLLFSKLPEVGLVKTRLTTLKDGWFEPEVASALYHCMLFDVVEIICAALADLEEADAKGDVRDTYELVISTAPARNLEPMRKLFEDAGTWPREIVFINDEGSNFDEHYNHAFQQTWDRGAGGIVLAPDQEMGVSVVGWTRDTDFSHTGVFYNQTGLTVLPAYIEKARSSNLPVLWLPPIPDVDTMADFYHNVTLVEALCYCAEFDDVCPPWRTAQALEEIGFSHIYVAPNDLRDPRDEIDQ